MKTIKQRFSTDPANKVLVSRNHSRLEPDVFAKILTFGKEKKTCLLTVNIT